MLGQWIINLDGEWWLLDENEATAVDGLESVSGPTLVLTDFDHAMVAVDTVSGPSSYAAPLIEKQLREVGTLDGPGRVLLHATQKRGGTTRVLYSAVPAASYADFFSQASQRNDHTLLISFASAMLRHAVSGSDGGTAVVFRHGRHLELLVAFGGDIVAMKRVTAFSTQTDDLEQALARLTRAMEGMRGESGEQPVRIRWFSWAAEHHAETELAQRFSELSGVSLAAPTTKQNTASAPAQVGSIHDLVSVLRTSDAVNGAGSKALHRAEAWLPAVAGVVLAVSLALFGLAWHWAGEARELRTETQSVAQEDAGAALRQMADRLSTANASTGDSSSVAQQFAFLSRLDGALTAPDLRRVVHDIGAAAPDGMQIVGISLAKTPTGAAIAIDGVVQKALRQAMADLQQLTATLRSKGYQVADKGDGAMDEKNSFRLTMTWEAHHGEI